MVFVLAGPFVRLDERIDEKPVVALIVDESISMSLPVGRLSETTIGNVATAVGLEQPAKDDPVAIAATVARLASLTRAELVRRVLDSQGPTTFRQLSDRFDLRRYTVARRAIRIDATNAAPSDVPSDKPVQEPSPDAVTNHSDSLDTALGSAIELAMDDASGRSLAAIILLTDGRSTIGIDPIDAVRKAAEASGGQPRAPIMAVPIGSIDLPVDVAIVEVLAAPEVALDDTVSIVSTIQSSNMTGKKSLLSCEMYQRMFSIPFQSHSLKDDSKRYFHGMQKKSVQRCLPSVWFLNRRRQSMRITRSIFRLKSVPVSQKCL